MDLATRLERFPREDLALTPTPLDVLARLGERLGPRVLLKRDDLTGLALGGDKPRKLEYELARARRADADVVVTCGSMQSNHARLTTAAARRLGMDCTVVLSRDAYDEFQGNLLTVRLLGADVRVVDVENHWALDEHVRAVCDELRAAGRRPHAVPISGTTPHSCLGYVRAGLELAAQLRESGDPPHAVYLPVGAGRIFTPPAPPPRGHGVRRPAVGPRSGLGEIRTSIPQPRGDEGSVSRLAGTGANGCGAGGRAGYRHWWAELTRLLGLGGEPPEAELHDEFVGREYGDPTEECL